MPVHNGASSLDEVLAAIRRQSHLQLVAEILFVEDASTDSSRELLVEFARDCGLPTRIIRHPASRGLAASYNEGIKLARTKRVILMHQDVVLTQLDSFDRISRPLDEPGVGSAHPVLLHPVEVWRTYNFWQKCLFSRYSGRARDLPTGKFDIYERSVLMEVGLFDEVHYRTAGEDGDLNARLLSSGRRLALAEVEVVHVHTRDPEFSLWRLYRKEAQIAEAYGALLRHWRVPDPEALPLLWFRQLMLLAALIPRLRKAAGAAVLLYAYGYTARVYRECYRDPRVLALPFVNVSLIPLTSVYALRGLLSGRQRL